MLFAVGEFVLVLPATACVVLSGVAWDYLILMPSYMLCIVSIFARRCEILIWSLMRLSWSCWSPRLDQMRAAWTMHVNQVAADHRHMCEYRDDGLRLTPLCVLSYGVGVEWWTGCVRRMCTCTTSLSFDCTQSKDGVDTRTSEVEEVLGLPFFFAKFSPQEL